MTESAAIEFAQRTRSALEGTQSAAHGIARVRYSHDAMIDLMMANPSIKQYEIAKHFGVTGPWVSRIVNSDAFNARLSQRKKEVIDPIIISNMEEKLMGLMDQSLEVIADKLAVSNSPDLALRALELSSKALGYGARKDNIGVQNNFVVALPPKAESAAGWAKEYRPGGVAVAEAVEVISSTPITRDLNALAAAAGV